MNTLDCILTRRSTRKYKPAPLDKATIETILEAGRYAPSGGNNQYTRFIVITNPEKLQELAAIAKAEFAKMEVTPGMYKSMANSVRASKGESYIFHYSAPVLIVTANKLTYGNNIADCACALENMMIAANALDLGSCWINQLKWLNETESIRAFFAPYGIEEDERIYGAVSIGYPDTESGLPNRNPLARTGNPITWVE